MGNRDSVTATFQELKRLTAEVNAMIEDGSFYTLPFHRRYRQIRKVKQLYSRLRGPLFDRDLVRLLSRVAPLTVLILGCNLGTSEDVRGAMGLRFSLSQESDSVERYELAITGPDMVPIEQVVSGDEGIITVAVPPGTNRTIDLLAIPKPADRFAIPLRGTATVDLAGGATSQVSLTLEPDPLEPVFAPAVEAPFGLPIQVTGQNEALPTLGDLDGDGDLDLLVGSYYGTSGGGFFYFKNAGAIDTPDFSEAAVNNPFNLSPTPDEVVVPRFADLDADGDLDIVNAATTYIGPYYDIDVQYFENVEGAFQTPTAIASITYADRDSGVPTLGDLDGDGDLDLLVGFSYYYPSSPEFTYFENIGSASQPDLSPTPQTNPFALSGIPSGVAPVLADLDGDGTLDILAGDYAGTLHYYENIGTPDAPDFAAPVQNPFGLSVPSTYRVVPTFGDLDGDGDLDLMVGEYNGYLGGPASIYYFENEAR